MITPLKKLLLASSSITLLSSAHAVLVVWDGGGDGSTWGDDANWVGGSQPTGADTLQINNTTVIVDTPGAAYSSNTSASSGLIIVINDGGILTSVNGNFNSLRYMTSLDVNNGGAYIDQNASVTVRTNLTIAEGGLVEGLSSIRDSRTLSVGGAWRMLGNTSAANFIWSSGATVSLLSTGTIEMDLYGNNSNDAFSLGNASAVLNLNAGNIVLTPQGGYVPQPGDQFDLWNLTAGTINPGDGSNITLAGYQLDVSQFATDGIVTIVPEPSTNALLAGLAMLVGAAYLRRRQSR